VPSNLAAHRATRLHARGDFALDVPNDGTPLRQAAAPEDWGDDDHVLRHYLAVHLPLAMEQGRYVWIGEQLVTRAGSLVTETGAPVYVGLARTDERWVIGWAGPRPSSVEPFPGPDLGVWPELDRRSEVVVAMDRFPGPVLDGLPLITQNLIVAGALDWSVRRGLGVRQLRGESRGYFAPVHLTSREGPPEFAAPIQVQADRVVVRTLIEPRVAYPAARAVAGSRGELPAWLQESR